MRAGARLKVAVVGCGIGGPAAALFLARAGHQITLFERSEELGPKGAGILLAPTGQLVLERLGLLQAVLERGSRVQRILGTTTGGRRILDLRYRKLHTGLAGIGIHRGALFTILRDAMTAAAIDVRSNWPVERIERGHLYRQDVEQRGDEPASEGPFDLVIVADGARSIHRLALGLQTSATPYSYGALWVSVPNWGDYPDNVLQQAYRGTRRMAGLLPSGRFDGGGRQISLFWSLPLAQLPLWRVNGLDRWKEDVLQLLPGAAGLLADVESLEQVTIASYLDVRTWSSVRDSCVVIGDAAHATSPQLGQGASLALVDAMVLAECLEHGPDVLTALLEYREVRRRHVRFYQLASKWMTPFFQSGHSYLGPPRDLFLGPLCRVPTLQREMVATMCGLKDGAFRRISREPDVLETSVRLALGSPDL